MKKMKVEDTNFDFERIEKQLKKSRNKNTSSLNSKVHDEFVRLIQKYGEKTNDGYILQTGMLIICGDWKCVTYITTLKFVEDCYLKCDIFYSAPGGSGDIEDIDFENRYDIDERLFFLKQLTEYLATKNQSNNGER